LVVVDTSYNFTIIGQAVVLVLIQLGGLGIMTLTTFFAYLMGSGTSLREYSHLKVLLGQENIGAIRQTIFGIAVFTLLSESLGAVAIYVSMAPELFNGNIERIWFAVFHSVSAFCNAGFSLTSANFMDTKFISNFNVQSVVMVLIFTGGLGYPVVSNLGSFLLNRKKNRPSGRLSVHTKIVLLTSVFLIIFGTAAIWILESRSSLRGFAFGEQLFSSLFQSVSARTAGFNTMDLGLVSVPTLLIIIFLMWVGASPGSTGGGIKTTALFLALLNISALIRGKNHVEVFRKQITDLAIIRSFSVIVLSIFFIGAATLLLAIVEPFPLERILFEVVSAIGTVGYSTGITAALSFAGKAIIIVTMFAGRVGLLAILISLTRQKVEGRFAYTQENVFVT
jgi:Trk-type K+ transport system membrane component